jgi:prolipoprotein diacylglyceryltransferase
MIRIDINPIAFTVFGISVRWYGVMIALGVLGGPDAAAALESMLAAARRLPRSECDKRIRAWQSR